MVCRWVILSYLNTWHDSGLHNIGRPLYAELSPVTDFREACCRQNENGECNRGGFCNFMHLRLASKDLTKSLNHSQRLERKLNPPKADGGAGGWEPGQRRRRSASPVDSAEHWSGRRGRDTDDHYRPGRH
jgi:splicing factor U2AF subunit